MAFRKALGSKNNIDVLAGFIEDMLGVRPLDVTIENPYSIKDYAAVVDGVEWLDYLETIKDISANITIPGMPATLKIKRATKALPDINAVSPNAIIADTLSEMQVKSQRFFEERSIYYPVDKYTQNYNLPGKMELDKEGKPIKYSSLIPVYSINVLGFKLYGDEDALRVFELYDAKRNKAPNKAFFKFAYFEYTKPNFETANQRHWRDFFLDRDISPKAPAYIKKAAETVSYANLSREEKRLISYAERAEQDYLCQIAFIIDEAEKKTQEKMRKENEENMREAEEKMRETEEKMRETEEKMRETEEKVRETEEKMRETEEKMRETEEKVRKEDRDTFLKAIQTLGEDNKRSFTIDEICALMNQKLEMDHQQ